MKASLLLAGIFLSLQLSAQFSFKGKVSDQNGNVLSGANIYFDQNFLGTVTDINGEFIFKNLNPGGYKLNISYMGYGRYEEQFDIDSDIKREFTLHRSAIAGEEVIVKAVRAGKKDPVAYSELTSEEIRNSNLAQDIPYLLSLTPSLVTSSDAGHGVGYTGLRIRGTDANRINITVDGIPLNDAESHGVFFVNMPDFASSLENVQVQRGVGTSTNGAAAFGASLNFQTNNLNKDPYGEAATSYGSFNTMKNSVKFGTGLLNDHMNLDVRLSRISSDGFIERASADMKSLFVSAGWYSEKSILKLNVISGKEKTYQAWDGVPGYMLSTNRRYNGIGQYTTDEGEVRYYDNETDNYQQDHYHLHFTHELSSSLYFNAGLHYTMGVGYYEQYKEDEYLPDYQMPVLDGGIEETDLIRRKWLDNDFYGTVFSFNYKISKVDASFGGGWNNYTGDHFGTIVWARYTGGSEISHRWYENQGDKMDYNVFSKLNYSVSGKVNLFGDLQIRGIDYVIDGIDDDLRDITQDHNFLFFNPKFGLNYSPDARQRAYFSFAVANREPNRSNFTDAAPGTPLPVFETLYDYEGGYTYATGIGMFGVNIYYMDYNNQLVLTGEINDVGSAIMTNVKNSYRLGIELQGAVMIVKNLKWNGNITLSQNRITGMTFYVDNWSDWDAPYVEDFDETEIAFSPSVIAASQFDFEVVKNLDIVLQSKYVGKQYIDNTASNNRKLNPYFVNDLRFSYIFSLPWVKELRLNFMAANIFNELYESNAWVYRYMYNDGGVVKEGVLDGYYPQAGRHYMAGITLSF